MLRKKIQGFGIVGAIFVLVVLASLGAYLVGIAGMVTRGADYSLLSVQAEMAALSGLEWGFYQLTKGRASCSETASNFNFTTGPLNGFVLNIIIPCTINNLGQGYSAHMEGTTTYKRFTIVSIAQFETFGSSAYVSRELSGTLVQ